MTVKSLTLHRNSIERHRKNLLSKSLKTQVEKMVRTEDIRAYAVVGINSEGKAFALWDTGAILPQWAFADTVATVLKEDILDRGAVDDWRPNLTLKGSS
jgi:hypothetical protein